MLGTRPEIIKFSGIIRELEKRKLAYFILHTGQHYSANLDDIFFEELSLPKPKYNLNVGSGTHAGQTAKMLMGIEEVLEKEKPKVVLVQGDTNSVLSGALTAAKLHIKVAHVEAGLRSYNMAMAEEINRIVADHISDYLFAATKGAMDNIAREGIEQSKVYLTGNTVVDAVKQNLQISSEKVDIVGRLNLETKRFALMTLHRAENTDDETRLRNAIIGIGKVHDELKMRIIFPIHPRTKKMIEQFAISIPKGIELIEPIGYLEFLQLEQNAAIILTDSGGLQEEGCVLGTPCVTLRDETERPETVQVGANIVAGTDPNKILEAAKEMMQRENKWVNPFGDGFASAKIIDILEKHHHK